MTIERQPNMTVDQIRQISKDDYYNAYISVANAQFEHTKLLQKLAKLKSNDFNADQRAKNALKYHQRVEEEFKGLNFDVSLNHDQENQQDSIYSQNLINGTAPKTNSNLPRLPIELNFEIVEQIISSDPSSPENQKTLKSLCETSNEFKAIAEPHLWKDIGDLDTIEKQWKFRYTISIQPELANRVKKVNLFWLSGGSNFKLLQEICSSCSNIEDLLIQRGGKPGKTANEDDYDTFEEQDGIQLCQILKSLKKLKSFTWACYVSPYNMINSNPTNDDEESSINQFNSDHAKGIFDSLINFDIRGWSNYFLSAFLNNLTNKVQSIRLSADCEVDHEELTIISSNCVNLREISVRYFGGLDAIDLIDFARKIKSLESIEISKVNQEGQEDWFGEVLLQQNWNKLNTIICGMNWTLPISTFTALSYHYSPSLMNFEVYDIADEVKEETIVKMLQRQSSTLKECQLGGGSDYFIAGKATLKEFQNAKQLRSLSLPALSKDVGSEDVDKLLQTCPNLWEISENLKDISEQKAEWNARESLNSNQADSEWENKRLGT